MNPSLPPTVGVRRFVGPVLLAILAAPIAAQVLPRNPQEPRNLLENASFENPPVAAGTGVSLAAAGAWSAVAGNLVLQNRSGGTTPSTGDQHLELAALAVVRQTCATQPGKTYALSLAYCPRPTAGDVTFEIWFAGSLLETVFVPAGSAATWQPKSHLVVGATAQDRVELRSLAGGALGVGIDDCFLIPYSAGLTGQRLRNGNFEEDPHLEPDTSMSSAVFIGWYSLQNRSIEVRDLGTAGNGASGKNVVDLDEALGFGQRVFVIPDRDYTLRFAFSPNPADDRARSFTVRFAGQLLETVSVPSGTSIAWTTRTYTVRSEAPLATLEFQDLSGGLEGTLIDAASLNGIEPEPETAGQVRSHKILRHTPTANLRLDANDMFARGVTSLGDLDGDGVQDLAVGAVGDDDGGDATGAAWIVFLRSDRTVKASQKISETAGGLVADLQDGDGFGRALSGIGDLDGDGIPDLAVGANEDDSGSTNAGAVYVLFLNRNGTVKGQRKISAVSGDPLDFIPRRSSEFGASIANMGDFDGDGVNDLLVGAFGREFAGMDFVGGQYLWLMNRSGSVKRWFYYGAEVMNPRTQTLAMHYDVGTSCAGLGDVDGDGVRDLLTGAQREGWIDGASREEGSKKGAVYVLLLNSNGTIKTCQRLGDRAGGFEYAIPDGARWGESAFGLGDLDGNGVVDVAIGSRFDFFTGAVFLCELSGRPEVPPPPPLRADFSASPLTGAAPLLVTFTDLSTGPVASWSWDFGDGGGSSAASPSHSYAANGVYSVRLTVSDGLGGSHTRIATNLITVADGGTLPPGVAALGCGVNPAGSFRILSGSPRVGSSMTFGVDNPFGTQAPGSIPRVLGSWNAPANRPCGTLVAGQGMAAPGTSGELLIGTPTLFNRAGLAWAGPGNPAPVVVPIPSNVGLIGRTLCVQGRLVDSVGAPIRTGLANGFALTLQP